MSEQLIRDWSEVERHLVTCERAYSRIGTPGYFVREHVLRPLRDRWNGGERSEGLATEILGVSL